MSRSAEAEQGWRQALERFQAQQTPANLLQIFAATEAYLAVYAPGPLYSASHITTIALEFLHQLFSQVSTDDPGEVLHDCIRKHIVASPSGYSDVEEHVLGSYQFDITARLDFDETLREVLAPCPLHLQALLLYCLHFPQSRGTLLQAPQITVLDRWFLQHMTRRFAGGLLPMADTPTFPVPQTEGGRLFFFLSLYKSAPELFVLLFLFQSFEHFLQFLQLFGGRTLTIPTLEDLETLCTTLSHGYDTLETAAPLTNDGRFVLSLMRDAPASPTALALAPDVGHFFESAARVLFQNYGAFFEQLIRHVDFHEPQSVLSAYEILQKDLTLQTAFFRDVFHQESLPPLPDRRSAPVLDLPDPEPFTPPAPPSPPRHKRPSRRHRLPKRPSRRS